MLVLIGSFVLLMMFQWTINGKPWINYTLHYPVEELDGAILLMYQADKFEIYDFDIFA